MSETTEPRACTVHIQGAYVETAPGIRIRGRSRPCGAPARWLAHWNDIDEVTLKPVSMVTEACELHHQQIVDALRLLVDHYGQPVLATWAMIGASV